MKGKEMESKRAKGGVYNSAVQVLCSSVYKPFIKPWQIIIEIAKNKITQPFT